MEEVLVEQINHLLLFQGSNEHERHWAIDVDVQSHDDLAGAISVVAVTKEGSRGRRRNEDVQAEVGPAYLSRPSPSSQHATSNFSQAQGLALLVSRLRRHCVFVEDHLPERSIYRCPLLH